MSGSGTPLQTSLTTRFVFGCNTEVNGNVSFTTDDTIAYVAGHTIVLYNTTDKRQRHLHSSDITDVITAYASGPGKRLAAVAERGDKPKVHVSQTGITGSFASAPNKEAFRAGTDHEGGT